MKKRILGLILVVALMMTALLPTGALADTMSGTIKMSSSSGTLNLRKGAGTNTASVGYVKSGAAIKIYTDQTAKDKNGNPWTKIKVISTGKYGYVRNIYLSFNNASSKKLSVYVSSSGGQLYVRKGGGTKYAAVGIVKHGAAITLLKKGSLWSMIKVNSNGLVGYINTSHIKGLEEEGKGNLPSGTYTAGTVTTKYASSNVKIRSSASTSGGILGSLPNGSKVRVLSSSGSWYKVKTKSGLTGYMSKSYITSGFTAKIAGGTVNFRKGAGTDYSVIKVLSSGTSVKVRSVSGKWAKVTYGGKTGYINVSYLNY